MEDMWKKSEHTQWIKVSNFHSYYLRLMPMGGQQHAEQKKNKTKKGQTNTLFGAMRWRESSSCSFGIVSSMKSLLNITQPALGDVESWKIERKRRRLSLSPILFFCRCRRTTRPSSESGLSPKRRVLSFNDAPMLSPLGSIQFPRQSSRKEHKRVSLIMIPRASQHHCCRSLTLFFFEHKKNHYIYRRL